MFSHIIHPRGRPPAEHLGGGVERLGRAPGHRVLRRCGVLEARNRFGSACTCNEYIFRQAATFAQHWLVGDTHAYMPQASGRHGAARGAPRRPAAQPLLGRRVPRRGHLGGVLRDFKDTVDLFFESDRYLVPLMCCVLFLVVQEFFESRYV